MSGALVRAALVALGALEGVASASQDSAEGRGFLSRYCVECHGADEPEAGLRLDETAFSDEAGAPERRWDLVGRYVERAVMPPRWAIDQPEAHERETFLEWLVSDAGPAPSEPADSVPLRRLTRRELDLTLRDVFDVRGVELPMSFPADPPDLPFDTFAPGLSVSGTHLEALLEASASIADRYAPAALTPRLVRRSRLADWNLGSAYWARRESRGFVALSGINISAWVGSLWDHHLRAPEAGVYRLRLCAMADPGVGVDGRPLRLGLYAVSPDDYDVPERALRATLPRLGELEIVPGYPREVECLVELEAGEAVQVFLENRLPSTYERYGLNRPELAVVLRRAVREPAPTVLIDALELFGPVAHLDRQLPFVRRDRGVELSEQVLQTLQPLAERAFRRPLTGEERTELVETVRAAPSYAGGMHDAVRSLVISLPLLFLDSSPPVAGEYGLASLLAYFLWSGPPDAELLHLAAGSRLSDPEVLRQQTRRLLAHGRHQAFIDGLAEQWLGNRSVENLMVCDVRQAWSETLREGILGASRAFLGEVLDENLSVRTLIDSSFTYASRPMRGVWGLPGEYESMVEIDARAYQSGVLPRLERLDLARLPAGTPPEVAERGGILGLASVLAATGDGVNSSPIRRGVWVLDMLLGEDVPPPPESVPALAPDVPADSTRAQQLAAHRASSACAACHAEIDPIGLALERYGATGGFRERYPLSAGFPEGRLGAIVEADAVLPDGSSLGGLRDLKDYVMQHPEMFTRSLASKLYRLALGRELTREERAEVQALVDREPAEGYGFADLVVEVAALLPGRLPSGSGPLER